MESQGTISFKKLLSNLTCCEWVLLLVGVTGAILAGLFDPLMCFVLSMLLDELNPNAPEEDLLEGTRTVFFITMVFGGICWVFSYIHYAFWQHLAERVTFDLRKRYLLCLLKQEASYFEEQQLESLPAVIGSNFMLIKQGLGEKFSNIIQVLSNAVFGIILSLYLNVYIALVGYAFMPLLGISFPLSIAIMKKSEQERDKANISLATTVEETLSAMRVVSAFNLEDQICRRYDSRASEQLKRKLEDEWIQSIVVAIVRTLNFVMNPYMFFITTKMLVDGVINPRTDEALVIGEVFAILYSMKLSLIGLLSLQPNYKAYSQALIAGTKVFEVIEREPKVRDHENCQDHFTLNHDITFKDVSFKFPHSEKSQILERATFSFMAGKNNGVIGKSGMGKSTVVQLIARFYEIDEGEIFFDGISLRDIQLEVLREQIGYVSQEPALLIGSIRDNLLFSNCNASDDQIKQALGLADAKFVFDLPDGLDTYVGSSTAQNLSGGQKQKISIARALLKQPKLLILDEATSALDVASEREILQSIEDIRKHKSDLTIITIAHRIETIRLTDRILFLEGKDSQRVIEKQSEEFEQILEMIQTDVNQAFERKEEAAYNQDLSPISPGTSRSPRMTLQSEGFSAFLKKQPSHANFEELASPTWRRKVKQQAVDEQKQELGNQKTEVGFRRIMQYSKGIGYIILAVIVGLGEGFKIPVESVCTVKIVFLYFKEEEIDDLQGEIYFYCYIIMFLALINFMIQCFHRYIFSYLGEHLSYNIRQELFSKIVNMPLSWFDNEQRSSGILGSLLCEKVLLLNSLTSETIIIIMESIFSLLAGLVVSLWFSWQMTLGILLSVPFLISGNLIQAQMTPQAGSVAAQAGETKQAKVYDRYEKSNSLLSDAIMNYKTVMSFGQKNIALLVEKYNSYMQEAKSFGICLAHKGGIAYGYSAFIRLFYFGILYYFGAFLVSRTDLDTEDITQSISAIFLCALHSGVNLSNMPSYAKGKAAAQAIFEIIDEATQKEEQTSNHEIKQGEIEFKRVNFMYQTRERRVLRYLSMQVPSGKKVAIAGYSGSGKSTIANLLLRFYEISDGQLTIDGIPINQYDLKHLRKQIGYVMQEPVLFNESIKQNIKYGNKNATDFMIYQAAKNAQALEFIESNNEDLKDADQFDRIKLKFVTKVSQLTADYPLISDLLPKIVEAKEMQLCFDLLSNSDENLLHQINENLDQFMGCVKSESPKHSATWEQLLKHFEFQSIEMPKIISYCSKLSQIQKDEVIKAIEQYPGNFNLQTVKAFRKEQSVQEKESQKTFREAIKEDKRRIQSLFEGRIQSLINQESFELGEGFNRVCGPKGSYLSGGQKQRIAIARALIKNPRILILDEATSALDELNQKLVQKALDKAMEGRTSVVIAHRLSTIKNCDWIYVMHQGRIIEQGTYKQLEEDKTSYFCNMQKGAQEQNKL